MSANHKICSFCYRSSDSGITFQEAQNFILNQFVKSSERYLGTGFNLSTTNITEDDLGQSLLKLESCPDCLLLVESFCKLFHKWKHLELELEWKLRQLSNVISSADRLRSRRQNFEARFSSEEGLFVMLSNFRRNFQRKCNEHFSKSFPKVVLQRPSTQIKHEPINHNANKEYSGEITLQKDKLFLGWISTLSAVLMLGSLFQNHNETPQNSDKHHNEFYDKCYDDDDVTVQFLEHSSSADNQALSPNILESDLENELSKFQKQSTSPPIVQLNLKRQHKKKNTGQKIRFFKRCKTNHPITAISNQFKCFSCNRNFKCFPHLQRRRRASTHVLAKLKLKRRNYKALSDSSVQIQTIQTREFLKPVETVSIDKEGTSFSEDFSNVGTLRPLRKAVKQSVVKAKDCSDLDSSSSSGQDSSDDDDDDFTVSSSTEDESGSISNLDDEPDFPLKTGSYICKIGSCMKSFNFKEELENHKKLHGSFSCTVCDVIEDFAPNPALHESERIKTATLAQPKSSGWRQCAKSYSRNKKRKRGEEEEFLCAECNKVFSRIDGLVRHKKHCHPPDGISKVVKCTLCTAMFISTSDMLRHIKNVHKDKEALEDIEVEKSKKWVEMCSICGVTFNHKKSIYRHYKNFHPGKKAQDN